MQANHGNAAIDQLVNACDVLSIADHFVKPSGPSRHPNEAATPLAASARHDRRTADSGWNAMISARRRSFVAEVGVGFSTTSDSLLLGYAASLVNLLTREH